MKTEDTSGVPDGVEQSASTPAHVDTNIEPADAGMSGHTLATLSLEWLREIRSAIGGERLLDEPLVAVKDLVDEIERLRADEKKFIDKLRDMIGQMGTEAEGRLYGYPTCLRDLVDDFEGRAR